MDKLDYARMMAATLRNQPRQPTVDPMADSVMSRPAEPPPELNADLPIEPVSPEDWVPNPKSLVAALKGAPVLMGAISKKLLTEGREYEGRLFGGSYGANQFRMSAKDAPKRKIIAQGRDRYNQLRQEAGLDPVSDWNTLPSELIQKLDVE